MVYRENEGADNNGDIYGIIRSGTGSQRGCLVVNLVQIIIQGIQ